MKTISALVASLALIAAGSAMADSLLQKDGCMVCHNGKLGPTFKDVNSQIKGNASLVADALNNGSKTGKYAGVKIPMPPQKAHAGDAAKLAQEITAQK
jgi:cytochrome c551/c552